MRAREFCTNNINESLNQPYDIIEWDDDWDNEVTAWASVPDGTDLKIEFDQSEHGWHVSFRRGGTMEKTGQGDAQRIFATVLEAIKRFIKEYDPDEISFSSLKRQDSSGSRQSLYNALAKKYAAGLGYTLTVEEAYHLHHYLFKKIQPSITESVGDDDVDQIINDFIKHYEDDPLSVFMQAKASYLYAVERAKDFSNKADDLYRSHGNMSREEFQNTVMKYFGKHLRNNGFPRHASKDWAEAEHQLRDELMNSDQLGVTESDNDDSKKLKGFHQSLGNAVRGHVSQMQANMAILKAQHPDTWLWEPGDIVYSAETGRTYEIIGPWLDNRGTAKYLYHGNDEEKGTFVADRAHQTLKKISGKQGLSENFADGRNPGRKGLSRRMGIPKKSTLGQLEKIARGSTGERRRMAQWQLNMRRGRNKKK
jgi:hypothetical protein